MQKLNLNRVIVEVTKNEGKEVQRLKLFIGDGRQQKAEQSAELWIRSAPDDAAKIRRRNVASALGLYTN